MNVDAGGSPVPSTKEVEQCHEGNSCALIEIEAIVSMGEFAGNTYFLKFNHFSSSSIFSAQKIFVITFLFTKLPWPLDKDETARS